MRKLMLMVALTGAVMSVSAQKFNEMINLQRYAEANREYVASGKSGEKVLIGNSITDAWAKQRPEFFKEHSLIGRGISGQTTPQMLSRFRADVVALKPCAVVINAGINDIAENTGAYSEDFTFGNIVSMVEIARANGIKVVLTSILPASRFSWSPEITDVVTKVDALNARIKAYAVEEKIIYVDYNSSMRDNEGGLPKKYAADGVHPTAAGYEVMERILLEKAR